MESGIALVEDASMVTTEFPIGVVVPNDEGVEVPLTAPDIWEKAVAVMSRRGDRVSKVELSEETWTCK